MKLTEINNLKTSKMLYTVLSRIEKLIDELNYTYRKDAGVDFDIFRKVSSDVDEKNMLATVVIFTNGKASDSEKDAYAEMLEAELVDEGIKDGVLPVQVSMGPSAFERDAYTIQIRKGA